MFLVPPTVQALEQRVSRFVGDDVRLQCKAEASPRPEFRWLHNGRFILTNNTKYQQITGLLDSQKPSPYVYESLNALAVRDLTNDDFGAYFCIAKNDYGENKAAVELISNFLIYIYFVLFCRKTYVVLFSEEEKYVDNEFESIFIL